MSAPALAGAGPPTVRIRGTAYPVLLPRLRDPRLHLAAVIVTLQVLGQTAFGFRLSIAQILVALGTCAALEVAIAFRRQRVIMWPASALLTGNGVAFVLRVPGTEHGDWWSLRGAWIFAATAAVGLLSKHLIRAGGGHVFNPSNIGLVLCFLVLGADRAEPLDFWWSPLSPWLALALVVIVLGGLAILSRLRLLGIALTFWLTFAAGLAVVAAAGHAMTARWHLGPVTGRSFWWILVTSPEVLVFLFFMITDPRTVPVGSGARRAYAAAVAVLATLLIAPQRTEYASKVALLGALALVCLARPFVPLLARGALAERVRAALRRPRVARCGALAGAAAFAGLLVAVGLPARPGPAQASVAGPATSLPAVTVAPSRGVATAIDARTSARIARDLLADLRLYADALRTRDPRRATAAGSPDWLAGVRAQIRAAAGSTIAVPRYAIERLRLQLRPGRGQGPPIVVASLAGTLAEATYAGTPARLLDAGTPRPITRTVELALQDGRFRIVRMAALGAGTAVAAPTVSARLARAAAAGFAGVRVRDVAREVGLDFRQGAFRFGVSADPVAMMGTGLCWIDYDGDGWLDLFVVNSYANADIGVWDRRGGLPRTALFHNVRGRFVDVSRAAHADLPLHGTGCVAADLNGDGRTDLYVSTGADDKLLWNDGDGTFSEGARAAGVVSFGWHSGAAVADVNLDGRPDLFVAGYTDVNAPVPASMAGFPTNHAAVRDLLFLNEGTGPTGRARFREVGVQAGLESTRLEHGLGAVFTDVNGDGRPDLYVANDEDPNRLYLNEPRRDGLGFRFVERAAAEGVADPNAGMGVAAADVNGDGRPDLFVSNNRRQEHAAFWSRRGGGRLYADARPGFAAAFGGRYAGWGAAWVDLDRDGHLDLVLANGNIPVTNLRRDAGPVQVLENLAGEGLAGRFADAGRVIGLDRLPRIDGRGVAAADFDNDGSVEVAVSSVGGRLLLLKATGARGHWLEVALQGFHPGAVVTAVLPDGRRLTREVQAGSSYLSSEDPRLAFGLGSATRVRALVVRYPDGRTTRLRDVAVDRILRIGG